MFVFHNRLSNIIFVHIHPKGSAICRFPGYQLSAPTNFCRRYRLSVQILVDRGSRRLFSVVSRAVVGAGSDSKRREGMGGLSLGGGGVGGGRIRCRMIWEKREEAELLSLLFLWKPLIHLVNMLHLPSGQQQVIQERYLIIVLFLLTMISYFPMAAEYHTATLKTYPAQHIFSNQCKFIWIDSG